MEMSAKLRNNSKPKSIDIQDLSLECCGYLKTKLFMAKRISDQQLQIDELKNALFNLTLKYTNLFDLIKNNKLVEAPINFDQINDVESLKRDLKCLSNNIKVEKNNRMKKVEFNIDEKDDEIDLAKTPLTNINISDDNINLSNDVKSLDFEKINNSNKQEKKENQNDEEKSPNLNAPEDNNLIKQEKDKTLEEKIKILEEENFSMKKNTEILLQELNKCTSDLAKISYEKFSLYTELNELLESLNRVDINELNKFYLNNMDYNNTINSIYTAMGIKYNILSASNALGMFAVNHSFPLKDDGNFFSKLKNFPDTLEKTEKNDCLGKLFSEKYLENIREKFNRFDEELNHYVYQEPEKIQKKAYSTKNTNTYKKAAKNVNSQKCTIVKDFDTNTDV